ncbi:MAG: hypothetical protein ABFR95_07900 [Actinomycetota bacterium]
MDIRVLGPLEVFDGDTEVALVGPKRNAVLSMLIALTNSVVSTDRLIDQVWGGNPPASAKRVLVDQLDAAS